MNTVMLNFKVKFIKIERLYKAVSVPKEESWTTKKGKVKTKTVHEGKISVLTSPIVAQPIHNSIAEENLVMSFIKPGTIWEISGIGKVQCTAVNKINQEVTFVTIKANEFVDSIKPFDEVDLFPGGIKQIRFFASPAGEGSYVPSFRVSPY